MRNFFKNYKICFKQEEMYQYEPTVVYFEQKRKNGEFCKISYFFKLHTQEKPFNLRDYKIEIIRKANIEIAIDNIITGTKYNNYLI